MNSALLLNHERLLEEVTSDIDSDFNSELDESSEYSLDDWEDLYVRENKKSKTIRKYERGGDYFSIIEDKLNI